MNKKKRGILLILSIIFLVAGIILFSFNYKSTKKEDINGNEISKIVDSIIENEFENLKDDEKEDIKTLVSDTIDNTDDNDILLQCNFILGYIELNEKEYESSRSRFDKVIKQINRIKNIDMRISTYYELSRVYLNEKQYEKSEEAFNNAKEIALNASRYDLIIEYMKDRSYEIMYTPDGNEKAIELLEEALKISEEIVYDKIEDVYIELGIAYWYGGRLLESTEAKLEALSIAQAKGDEEKICKILTDLGAEHLAAKEYDEAADYLTKALEYKLNDKNEDAKSKTYALLNLSQLYIHTGEYDLAKETFEQLEEYIEKQDDDVFKEDCFTTMLVSKANLLTAMGDTSQALEVLKLAEERYNKRTDFRFYGMNVKFAEGYGDIYYKMGDYEKALSYHKEAEKLAKEMDVSEVQEEHNEKIYKDYKALGDYDNAIAYLEKNNELKTEISRDKSKQYSQYLVSKFESDKKEEELLKLQEYRSNTGKILICLVVITLIISIFTYTIYKKNKEINRLNKLFKNLSVTDALTSVQNRRALDEFLAGNWALYKDTQAPISFIMLDIDYFKKYNDNYGHIKGDKALELVAKSIKQSCRKLDFVARYGGEEFTIVMLNTDKDEAISVVERINEDICNLNIKHEYSEVSDRVTISVGISTAYIGTTKDYEEYIKTADKALYKSKEKGRNTYTFLDMEEENK